MPSPFKVHELLNSVELEELEAFAREPGRTIDECRDWLKARGFALSRSSVGRWLADFKAELRQARLGGSAEVGRSIVSSAGLIRILVEKFDREMRSKRQLGGDAVVISSADLNTVRKRIFGS
jgi:hypothetical protein